MTFEGRWGEQGAGSKASCLWGLPSLPAAHALTFHGCLDICGGPEGSSGLKKTKSNQLLEPQLSVGLAPTGKEAPPRKLICDYQFWENSQGRWENGFHFLGSRKPRLDTTGWAARVSGAACPSGRPGSGPKVECAWHRHRICGCRDASWAVPGRVCGGAPMQVSRPGLGCVGAGGRRETLLLHCNESD